MGTILTLATVAAWVYLLVTHWRQGPFLTLLLAVPSGLWLALFLVVLTREGNMGVMSWTLAIGLPLAIGYTLLMVRRGRANQRYADAVQPEVQFRQDVRT